MRRHLSSVLAGALMIVAAGSASAAGPARANAPDRSPVHLRATLVTSTPASAPTAVARAHPQLVPDPAEYSATKQRLDREADAASRLSAPARISGGWDAAGPRAPAVSPSWQGLKDAFSTPSDSTSAIGTTRFIEMVNTKVAMYTRAGALVAGSNTDLNTFTGSGGSDSVFDPQVMWDGQQNRFFYAADQVVSASDNRLAYGFSKTATPSSQADFCKYTLTGYNGIFPDYPKLGDSKHFALIGVNTYSGQTFVGSDVVWITKPPVGAIVTCPATLNLGRVQTLKADDGFTRTFTPVPAQQTDSAGKGWIVSRALGFPIDGSGATSLYLYKVTKDVATGAAVIATTATRIPVAPYNIPPNASQSGAPQTLDTSDTRLTQAVSAIDPRFGRVAIWTQHTVRAMSGPLMVSAVRWYELDPTNAAIFQTGTVALAGGFAFNGAIAPDRQSDAGVARFGSNMVLTYNVSSSSTFPKILVRSKLGASAISAPLQIRASSGPDVDFACPAASDVCRWGDYAAATPDPVFTGGSTKGRVWITNQWNVTSVGSLTPANWRTWNSAVVP